MRNDIAKEMEQIALPPELHQRSWAGIEQAIQEQKRNKKPLIRSPKLVGGAAAAILIVVLATSSTTGLATMIKGYYQDIVNRMGAVTGTQYNQATEEIAINLGEPFIKGEKVVVPITVKLKNADSPPFSLAEAITVGTMEIQGANGEVLRAQDVAIEPASQKSYSFEIADAHRLLSEEPRTLPGERHFKGNLVLDQSVMRDKANPSYTVTIQSLYQHAKAEAPLEINGHWQVPFPVLK